ncbi:transposase, partial [Lactiplantibacillus paraplantarum]
MRSNRKYSFDEKINILNLIDNNHTVQSIARDLQINKNVIHQWKRLYDLNGS